MKGPIDKALLLRLLAEFHNFDRGARESAISALKEFPRQEVVDLLANVLTSDDSQLRCDGAEALIKVDPAYAVALVIPLLKDPDGDVRWHACGLLHDCGDRRASEPLVRVLMEDPEGDVRLAAAWALGTVGDASALPALAHAVESDNGMDYEGRSVREAAAAATTEILQREQK
jgi:HEAT repeat protein